MALLVRRAQREDARTLAALEARCFTYDRIGLTSFQRFVRRESSRVWVAVLDGVIVGYCIILTRKNSQSWRLYSLATAPEARGKGVARALMEAIETQAVIEHAQRVRLEVKVDNQAAIDLYRKLDFEVIDLLPAYYDDGTDGYRLQRTLA
ncbi:GNAT family N-acetyltransferase [Aliidiomarina sanyensis]|uniref:N-acetyltransferase n=1 Tax=Aliidiomarina sanyensis TaxID=1249555 RepID=A0A432WBJ8_9GAMM|nr:N-acetyltransferase [Aliidiomarina sanyensis]RUO29133.1 N-acetyltransferase [Aliidiomarina sanyensis]